MELAKVYNYDLAHMPEITKYFEASLSENTKKAFFSDLRHFEAWGGNLPGTMTEVCLYLNHFANKLRFSTLQRRINSIKQWHILKHLPNPVDNPEVQHLLKGIRRLHTYPKEKATPLTIEHVIKIYDKLYSGDFHDLRNLVLISLGFFGAFRRSELVGIKHEDLTFTEQGVEIFILKSKTDQMGNGHTVAIPYGTKTLCPVSLLREYIRRSGITKGSIFKLSPQMVNLILKEVLAFCDIPEVDGFSGHSLRRGFATTASRKGSSVASIMRQGRWVSYNSVIGYIDEATRFNDNAVTKILEN